MKLRVVLLLVVVAGAAGGGWWWGRAGGSQAVVAQSLPATPDLGAATGDLRAGIAAANARARARLTAVSGLVELSRLYHANGFFAEAIQCYAGLEKLQPADAHWLHLHASILAGYGELEPAIALWQRHRIPRSAPA